VLLCGGDKRTQDRNIRQAKQFVVFFQLPLVLEKAAKA
jgi:putative component of toxin-antitoxin plasmid stabilization module